MRNPKQLCRNHNLYSYQARKGAELMAQAFADLIDRISGKGTWESNPYCFCYEFELVK